MTNSGDFFFFFLNTTHLVTTRQAHHEARSSHKVISVSFGPGAQMKLCDLTLLPGGNMCL